MPSLVTEVALAVEEAASIEVAHCITCSTDPYPWVILSLGWCSDDNRVVHINSKLHAIFCGIFITLVAVIVPILFRYSHNRVRGAHLRPRGRCHNITITSGSVLSPAITPAKWDDELETSHSAGPYVTSVFAKERKNHVRGTTAESWLTLALTQARVASDHAGGGKLLYGPEYQSDRAGIVGDEDLTSLRGLATIPGSKQGSTGSVNQSSSITDNTWFDTVRANLYRSASSLVNWGFAPIRYRYLSRFGTRPHLRALHGRISTLSVFAFGGEDCDHDVNVLANALMSSYPRSLRLEVASLKVAFGGIKDETKTICSSYGDAPGAHLLVYLTGHGNADNDMFLSGLEGLSETYLFKLFSKSAIAVPILVDICREGTVPGLPPPKGVSLIRTCSLGEIAGACRIKGLNAPNSCFLIALMMAACASGVPYTNEPPTIKPAVQKWLDRLINYLEYLHFERHREPAECVRCGGLEGPCPQPRRQNVDWTHAKNLDGLAELMKILEGTEIAQGVYRWFTENSTFRRVNGFPDTVPNPAFNTSHGTPDQASQHARGAMSASIQASHVE